MAERIRNYHVPGRTEIIGNHSDHQHGCVIAAAIDRCIHAEVEPRDDRTVIVDSAGHPMVRVDLDDLAVRKEERGDAAALVRGVAKYLTDSGYRLRGFTARTRSDVPVGSGMSSSAAFEILVGKILIDLAEPGSAAVGQGMTEAVLLAQAGSFSEREYYGKPSGLMDQLAIAVGDPVMIDFADPQAPVIEPIAFDPADHGYKLCLIQTGASHADLGEDYASIVREMREAAAYFGKEVLREVDSEAFRAERDKMIEALGERPVLRAEHFFEEVLRVREAQAAMNAGNMDRFLELVKASGRSSREKLQNIVPVNGDTTMRRALDASDQILSGAGATRVHGGGFAGTVQAWVPTEMAGAYQAEMERACGKGACLFVEFAGKYEEK